MKETLSQSDYETHVQASELITCKIPMKYVRRLISAPDDARVFTEELEPDVACVQ